MTEIRANAESDSHSFLKQVSGVIHVGANVGQEKELYDQYDLNVLWIEPIPEIFAMLQKRIQNYPKQRASQALITDHDNREYVFHIANNWGASSSILDIKLHKDIWPTVAFERAITLCSKTLPTLLNREHVNLRDYDALVLDTQGSELLVLQGAATILQTFKFIELEAADFEAYAGGCQIKDIEPFLKQYGFQEISRHQFAQRAEGGRYYDLTFQRQTPLQRMFSRLIS